MCAEDNEVVIEVEDNGVGMDEVTRQRLFEPFFTTKDADRGTGLGVSITYAIVRNHELTGYCLILTCWIKLLKSISQSRCSGLYV